MNSPNPEEKHSNLIYYIIASILTVAGFIIFQWGMLFVLIGGAFIYLMFRTYSSQSSFYATFDPNLEKTKLKNNSSQNNEQIICPSCGSQQKTVSKFCKDCGYNFQLE